MGSPLGPVLANIFMVALEDSLVNSLSKEMPLWFRYVDDTFTIIPKEEITNVIRVSSNFHKDINFTHEIEKDNCISFLDVKIKKQTNGSFITQLFMKKTDYIHLETDTNIYIN